MFDFFKKDPKAQIKLIDSSFFTISDNDIKLKDGNGIDNSKVNIIKLSSESCPACKMFRQPLKTFELNNQEIINSYELDIDENRDFASKLNIRSIPSNLIFHNWQLVNMVIWADLNKIAQIIHQLWFPIK